MSVAQGVNKICRTEKAVAPFFMAGSGLLCCQPCKAGELLQCTGIQENS